MTVTTSIKTLAFASLLALAPAQMMAAQKGGTFTTGDKTFLLNGKPFVVKAAELHYPRIPRAYWEHRIKMCKALGMNTVCLYVFWNIHEQEEGKFDFTGNNDVAAFCRLAQKNGMYVIVRPGPYVCAEWEMGGLPWWLLKKKDIRLREQDPYFMQRVEIFEKEVGKQLAPLTIQNGGPIIMVQVENEYGSYGKDKPYVSAIRDIVRKSGFDKVSLFQCDWSSNFLNNGLDDLTWTMNFGTGANIDQQFKRLGEVRPNAPKMCSEFWSGWFDKWGANHETRPAADMIAGIDEMLSKGISFFACTFQPDGNFIGQYRFYIQVDVSQTLIRISAPYQFFACIYLQRITAHTPSSQFHTNFIHPCGTFQLIGNPCGSCLPVIPPFAQFIIIETVDCILIIGSGNGGNDTNIHF